MLIRTHFVRIFVCTVLVAFETSFAVIHDRLESLPTIPFDFVIVGGGTAGNVIANRLSEDPSSNVLVIESGPTNQRVQDSIVPFFANALQNTVYDWNYTTTAQTLLGGRVVNFPSGHILGGTSSINGMFYTRGSSADFDRFAAVTGDDGWSWDNVQAYIRKNERWAAPADNHNTEGQFDPAIHGYEGVNTVSLSGFPHSIDSRVIQTTSELPDDFPFNLDYNSGNPLGVGWLQATIKGGERSSSATSYLASNIIDRKNLHVVLNTRVTRVLDTSRSDEVSKPQFRTVEFVNEGSREARRIKAIKEVIISAGVIGTPRILLHSGIGEAESLEAVGVRSIVNLPDVGKNLSDQPALGNMFFVHSNDTLDSITTNKTLRQEVLKEWDKYRTGPLVTVPSLTTHLAWARVPSDSAIFNTISDPAAGENSPHFEHIIVNGPGTPPSAPGHFINVGAVVVSPTSRGSVSLSSADPFDQPLIDPAYLSTEFDVFAMREAIKSALRFLSAPVWKDYVIGPTGGLENATTDQLLDDYIHKNTFTSSHTVGTAAMSPKNANYGVVDPDLRVKRVSGLRVVDASIMPFVTCGHTQAPTYIIAERAADLIKETWNLQ